MESFDLDKFRNEFLQSDGWKVSDCYKTYDDKFLRKDAQDAYEGAKWAWGQQQARIDELEKQKEVLLGEIYLMGDAIQYHRVLNILRGEK